MDIAPAFILAAILRLESGSELTPFGVKAGRIRPGQHGERGACQIRPATFTQYAIKGERFASMDYDHDLSVRVANRIICDLYRRTGSWECALAAYNGGINNIEAGKPYARKALK